MRQFRRVWLTPIAPLFAIVVVALSAYSGAAASALVQQGSVDQHHAAALDAKPCQNIDAHQPAQKKCSGTAAFSPAARRSRIDQPTDDSIVTAAGAALLHANGLVSAPPVRRVRPPPRPGARAPFWAVFAMAPQLRN